MAQAKRKTAPKRTTSRPRARRTASSKIKLRAIKPADEAVLMKEVEVEFEKLSPYDFAHSELLKTLDLLTDLSAELERRLTPVLKPSDLVKGEKLIRQENVAPVIEAFQSVEARVDTVAQRVQYLLAHLAI
ncbi:hypothetical protein DyAD56_16080 [Dyella sp. AD56]|uniref:hypothetical protein n=1 Tax=Dyella sp. AD56 TaxID=1528744 RepID=UPI000C85B5BF|nr:hypothetical protein [Dyella sp. AD56]PMQ04207.1 hypothetical protein DyAD56_16080 [Dyella sp. AD56]